MSDRTAEIRERLEDDTASTVSFSLNTVTCTDYIVISPKTRDEILALLTRVEEEQTPMHNVWALKREEVKAVGVLHPDGPECLENGQIVDVYPMHLAGPSDVLVYTSPQRAAEPVAVVDCGAIEAAEEGSATVLLMGRRSGGYQLWKRGSIEFEPLYTSPPQLPDAQQERDHRAMEKLRESTDPCVLECQEDGVWVYDQDPEHPDGKVREAKDPAAAILSPEGDGSE